VHASKTETHNPDPGKREEKTSISLTFAVTARLSLSYPLGIKALFPEVRRGLNSNLIRIKITS